MAAAKELLLAYMDLIRNPDEAISLFAVDAAIEIPYLVEVGLPGQFKGHEEILGFLRQINALFPDVAFMNVQFFMESPDQVVSEYEVHCSAPSTQRQYHQLFRKACDRGWQDQAAARGTQHHQCGANHSSQWSVRCRRSEKRLAVKLRPRTASIHEQKESE